MFLLLKTIKIRKPLILSAPQEFQWNLKRFVTRLLPQNVRFNILKYLFRNIESSILRKKPGGKLFQVSSKFLRRGWDQRFAYFNSFSQKKHWVVTLLYHISMICLEFWIYQCYIGFWRKQPLTDLTGFWVFIGLSICKGCEYAKVTHDSM